MNRNDILEIVDRYYKQYNLPEMAITDGEWDSLLTNLNNCLNENNNISLETAINIIIRRAINLSLLDDCDYITLYYVIRSLDDLVALSIPVEVINDLKYKVMLDGLKSNTKKEKSITK